MRASAVRASLLLLATALVLSAGAARADSEQAVQPSATTGYCQWSQINTVPYVPETDFYLVNHTIIRSCADSLTPAQRTACLNCAAQPTLEDCLGTVSHEYYDGADRMSCTWMDRNGKNEKTRDLYFSLGVNNPMMYSSTINMGRQQTQAEGLSCSVTRDYTVLSPEYHTAYFSVVGNGEVDELGPRDGDPLPGGRQPDASCVVQAPNTKCAFTIYHVPAQQWTISSREFWTTNPAIMRELEQGSDECLANPALRCPRASKPFRYRVHVTEHWCPPNTPIPELVRSGGQFPMGMPGYALYPGGFARNYRQTGFELDDVVFAYWVVKAQKAPLMVFAAPADKALQACPPGKTSECNYQEVYQKWAYPGTKCLVTATNKVCMGFLSKPVARHDVLMITYPRFPNQEQVAMPPETPPQIVDAKVYGWRTLGGASRRLL